jgi:enamine deaminase RidA (YjgF/YER057c/UK114 family)
MYTSLFKLVNELDLVIVYIKTFWGNQISKEDKSNLFSTLYDQKLVKPLIIDVQQTAKTKEAVCGVCLLGIEKQALSEVKEFHTDGGHYIAYQYKDCRYLWGQHEFINAEFMFEQCDYILRTLDFNPTDILRTWFYLNNINKNYITFNNARKKFFYQNKIDYSDKANDLPASTGIEGKSLTGNSVMQLTAMQGKKDLIRKKRIYNKDQNEANGDQYQFSPTFSRAMLTDIPGLRELHISGTASIGKKGETMFTHEGIRQIETTLRYVNYLLKDAGMTPFDICEGTVFMKNKELHNDFVNICNKTKFPHERLIPVITNICRDNLLFEIDAIAIN